MTNARSNAGAMGLMADAGNRTQRRQKMLNRKPPGAANCSEPDANIALARQRWPKQMKGELGDSAVLRHCGIQRRATSGHALAAGVDTAGRHLIELVPFDETLRFTCGAYSPTVICPKRGKTPTRLNERLHPVPLSISLR